MDWQKSNGGTVSREWYCKLILLILGSRNYWQRLFIDINSYSWYPRNNNNINRILLSAARTLYGAARQKQLPKYLKLNKNGQPIYGNIAEQYLLYILQYLHQKHGLNICIQFMHQLQELFIHLFYVILIL